MARQLFRGHSRFVFHWTSTKRFYFLQSIFGILTSPAPQAEKLLGEKEEQRIAVQYELDDLLMVFGDLEEKAEKYKVTSTQVSVN